MGFSHEVIFPAKRFYFPKLSYIERKIDRELFMERHFNLIKNETGISEKRVLPRFPFGYLVFKSLKDQERSDAKIFEVKDISLTGMQISIKDGKHDYHKSSTFIGTIHWVGEEIEVHGKVKWVTPSRVGMEFDPGEKQAKDIGEFLNLEKTSKHLKKLHSPDYELELPGNLKYWVHADGPIDLFVWTHPDGEFKKFQAIIYETFVEWEDIHGVKTGRLISKRDLDTPLITEDEFIFAIDQEIDTFKEARALDFINLIPKDYLPEEVFHFLKVKLGHRPKE
jgi:hypothetical protein